MSIRMPDHESYSRDMRSTLGSLIPPLPLEEDRIQATLQAAAGLSRAGRKRSRFVLGSAVAGTMLLVAAGFWRWSGANSDAEMSFGGAIRVICSPGEYTFGNVRAAAGKVWRDASNVLPDLMKQEGFTAQMRDELLRCLETSEPVLAAPPGRFEAVRARLQVGDRLSTPELEGMVQDLKAGIAAIKHTASLDSEHAEYADIMCRRLRTQIAETRDNAAPSTSGDLRTK